jgi:hypothetical protein
VLRLRSSVPPFGSCLRRPSRGLRGPSVLAHVGSFVGASIGDRGRRAVRPPWPAAHRARSGGVGFLVLAAAESGTRLFCHGGRARQMGEPAID